LRLELTSLARLRASACVIVRLPVRACVWSVLRVGQLLSKDVMHEPMRHLHAEFPRYLATHGPSISEKDRKRYMEQQALVSAILEAYDQTPEDTDRVATLMQQMQQCGPPPPEIAGPVADGVGCVVA
jgi:peroxin-19